ncbi:MAG: methyl-accepting chemotaxis protein [Treponema sp.]|jgi:methyl-accepting chemotaxis protein|nr:methyl-accepting chemotaxis protein [Treponema sp.]
MKIGKKLTLMIIAIVLFGIGILTSVILFSAQQEITARVYSEINNLAKQEANQTQIWFEVFMDSTRTISNIMEKAYESLEPSLRREVFDMILEGVLEGDPSITGVGSCWEPNALDGMDAQYVNTPGSDASGRFLSYWTMGINGAVVSPLDDCDIPGVGDYYLIAKRTGNETLIDPYLYDVAGTLKLITTVTVPIKASGRVLGAVLIDIAIDNIQKMVQAIHPYSGSVAAVYSNGGLVAAHFDPTLVGKQMKDTEVGMVGDNLDALMQAVKDGKTYSFTKPASSQGEEMFFMTVPIQVGSITTPWSLLIGIPTSVINEPVLRMLRLAIPIVVGMLALICIAIFFMARSISRPLGLMTTIFADIGEGNLTRRLEITSNDEIGDISRFFNQTIEKMRHLIFTIKEQSVKLLDIGGELSTNMTETAAAINEITSNIQSIKILVVGQSSSVTETNANMEQISVNIDKLNSHVKKQAASVAQSASAIEEMLANIQSVTNTLVKNSDNVKELTVAAEVGHTSLQEVSADIQEIAHESEGLLEINAVMENIASQTNLLSMNAAIEAAHAGEAGKGFAVVADEIRKLAENSSEQSQTISTVLKKIKDSIDKIIASTDNVLLKFEAINSGVKTVAEQEENIRSAMEEQRVGSKQILDAIGQVNELTGQVKAGSSEMLEGSTEVIHESKNLEKVTQEIAGGMNEMASGAKQINVAVSRVNELSSANSENINILVQEISRFKVE